MIIHAIIILACLGTITYYQCCAKPGANPDIEKAAELLLEEELEDCVGTCLRNDVSKK